ncbi:MAG: hypothetical protein R2911_04400 [Caldilineaceae bacterium]
MIRGKPPRRARPRLKATNPQRPTFQSGGGHNGAAPGADCGVVHWRRAAAGAHRRFHLAAAPHGGQSRRDTLVQEKEALLKRIAELDDEAASAKIEQARWIRERAQFKRRLLDLAQQLSGGEKI